MTALQSIKTKGQASRLIRPIVTPTPSRRAAMAPDGPAPRLGITTCCRRRGFANDQSSRDDGLLKIEA